jgi:hypothetical protein
VRHDARQVAKLIVARPAAAGAAEVSAPSAAMSIASSS